MSAADRPITRVQLLERLAELGIETTTVEHPPVFTVEEAKALRGEIAGAHTKNLFLRDKKKTMWLLVCLEERRLDLKKLPGVIGSAQLSFGSAERLMEHLGVIPGAVTPFAAINDHARQVTVLFDDALRDSGPWNFHPLDNAATTSIAPADLLRFLEAVGHPARFVDLEPATR